MAYCTTEDIHLGDIQADEGQKMPYMQQAFDEIDAKLGWLYTTPLDLSDAGIPNHEKLLIKMISVKLATGRMLLAYAAATESPMHSYGLRLIQEALDELHLLANGDVPLSFPRTDTSPDNIEGINTMGARTPSIQVNDSESLLNGFVQTIMNDRRWYVRPDDNVPD